MEYFILDEIPHITARTAEQRKELKEELRTDYKELLNFLLASSRSVKLHFRSSGNHGPVESGYEIEAGEDVISALERSSRFVKLRRCASGSMPPASPKRLVRRLSLTGVGAIDKMSPSSLPLLPEEATRFIDADPKIGASSILNALAYPLLVQFCETVRDRLPKVAYLAPLPQALRLSQSDTNWRHLFAALSRHGGHVCVSCLSAPVSDRVSSYAWLCLQYYLATAVGKVAQEEAEANSVVLSALVAQKRMYTMEFSFENCSAAVLDAFMRDTDHEGFEVQGQTQLDWHARGYSLRDASAGLRTHRNGEAGRRPFEIVPSTSRDRSGDHVAASQQLSELYLPDEAVRLLMPPFTFRDALQGAPHFVPQPFFTPALMQEPGEPCIDLGEMRNGQVSTLSLRQSTRHVFITGAAGSGKTHTMMSMAAQFQRMDVPTLIIDPVKRDFEPLLRTLGMEDHIYDFRKRWLRFNPFIPAANITLYNHSVVLAKSLAMLVPTNAVAFETMLKMVRETYRRKLGGGKPIDTGSFLLKTGADLRRERKLAPTFHEFLEIGMDVLRESSTMPGRSSNSSWLQDAMDAFYRRWESLRGSALGAMLSPEEDPYCCIDPIFTGTNLVEFTNWFDSNEVNAGFALVFSMLYEHRLSEYEDAISHGVTPSVRVAILDEAHRIVPASTSRGDEKLLSASKETSELFCHMIAECRALGQSLIVGDQSASHIDPNVLINTSTKIVHSTMYGTDKEILRNALSLSVEEQDYLSYLRPGEAVVALNGVYRPFSIRVPAVIGSVR